MNRDWECTTCGIGLDAGFTQCVDTEQCAARKEARAKAVAEGAGKSPNPHCSNELCGYYWIKDTLCPTCRHILGAQASEPKTPFTDPKAVWPETAPAGWCTLTLRGGEKLFFRSACLVAIAAPNDGDPDEVSRVAFSNNRADYVRNTPEDILSRVTRGV